MVFKQGAKKNSVGDPWKPSGGRTSQLQGVGLGLSRWVEWLMPPLLCLGEGDAAPRNLRT